MDTERLLRAKKTLDAVGLEIRPDDLNLAAWCELYWNDHKDRIWLDLKLCEEYLEQYRTILDVGSVPPFLIGALKRLNFPVVGVDIAPERFSSCAEKLNLKIHKCDIETQRLPFPDKTFDGVIVNEVFEHLRINLLFTMGEVYRVMRPGGLLMLSTPNLYSFRGISNFLLHQRAFAVAWSPYAEFRKLQQLGHMGHVREYTPVEVEELMVQCGFIKRQIIFRGKSHRRLDRLVTAIFPQLQPFFTMILDRL
jgi:SAM-dependent methyltransferase